jgi:DNA-binding LacI/PurR family transcriptional regulator
MVTMHDVAREAGVSQASVSHAYNRPEKLSAVVRERILEVARRLNYSGPNPAARSLRSGRAEAIGLMINEDLSYAFEDPAITQMMRGIGMVSDFRAICLTILPFPSNQKWPAPTNSVDEASLIVQKSHVDGLVVTWFPEQHPAIQAAQNRGLPIVAVDSPLSKEFAHVGIDERGSAYHSADHLLALGHRRIAILIDRARPDGFRGLIPGERRHSIVDRITKERLAGYEDAFRAHDAEFKAVPIFEAGGYRRSQADTAAEELLTLRGDLTAVLALSDVLALAVLDKAVQKGIVVPTQLSIVGFDDIPAAALRNLTTTWQPWVEKGRIAAELLLEQIKGAAPRKVRLETSFRLRGTTAPPLG